ncbi:BQ5605_C027g10308 [Microbotryum silenes-dioicae]|uniref:BQ5605_C027g10308 protein n=1 Tax=Microbotryum silenes-dioicae TaxID=796604 RepID=A0A2X0MN64_9BASI|nr:BQ5605_C027g10308 [Microbotryum silenes-dioicae]
MIIAIERYLDVFTYHTSTFGLDIASKPADWCSRSRFPLPNDANY